jgi:tRNA pseudouridine55 synthase
VNGLLLIDKPQGMTSHDVVARVRRIIGVRAIGHAGTLDPFATGLLILCIGQATRLSEYLTGEIKVYNGQMKLGLSTNTDDLEGEVITQRPVLVTADDLSRACAAFTGDLMQVPPQFSAIQVGGRRAYKMARGGETVELMARPVRILALELSWMDRQAELVGLQVTCTAGTYIRALARDIGGMLGCGAHLVALRRVQAGPFSLQEAVTLDTLQQAAAGGDWQRYLLAMDSAVQHLPPVQLDIESAQRLSMGQVVRLAASQAPGGLCRVYDAGGGLIAIGEFSDAGATLKPVKVFRTSA